MKLKGLRWWILGLIGLATVINYIDRNALAIMWPGISQDLELDKSQYSFIVSFFTIAYAISQALSGKLFDAIGTRLGFVVSIVFWSISSAMHGLARGLASFAIFRALLGLGEAGNWPGATKSNAEWFPVKERALAQGLFNAGASLGSIVSAPLIAFLYGWVGWQSTFIVIGGLGLIWIIPWLILNKNTPDKHPWITEEERQYILEGKKPTDANDKGLSIKQLFSMKQSWSVLLSRFLLDPIWWLFVIWLPLYLSDKFKFDIKSIGAFAWFPYVGAMIGGIGGGWLSGYFIKRGWTVNKARKTVIVIGALFMFPSLLSIIGLNDPKYAMIAIFFALLGYQCTMGIIQTLPSDYLSGKSVGTLAGLGGFTANVGVLLTTWAAPYLIVGKSYTPFFIMAAALVPLGVAAVFLLSGKIQKVTPSEKAV
jgi:MFS transporter, ACS family, hexuronate transporter